MGGQPKEVRKAQAKEARRLDRAGTTLKQRQVSKATRERYVLACNALVDFWKTYSCGPKFRPSIDMAVAEYVEHIYQEGDTVGMASNTLAAVQYFHPESIGRLKLFLEAYWFMETFRAPFSSDAFY